MAATYHQKPSQIFGMSDRSDEYLAHQFDEAVLIFGQTIEHYLNMVDEKTGKPKYTLERLLKNGPGPIQGTLEMLMAMTGESIH